MGSVFMKIVIKRIWNVLEVIILIYVVCMTVFFLDKNKYGFTDVGNRVIVSVDKDIAKTIPSLKKNDLLIIKKNTKVDSGEAYYYSVYNEKYVIMYNDLDNDKLNSKNIIKDHRIIGNSSIRIPLIGGYLNFVHSKVGFILCVFLPVFLVFIYQVYLFVADSKKERKEMLEKANMDEEII